MADERVAQVVRRIVRDLLKQREDRFGEPCTNKECPHRAKACDPPSNVVPIKRQASQ